MRETQLYIPKRIKSSIFYDFYNFLNYPDMLIHFMTLPIFFVSALGWSISIY